MNTNIASRTGPQHSEETIELAFQVWGLRASRSPKKTVDILARDFNLEKVPSDEAIRYWSKTRGWDEKLVSLVKQVSGGLNMGAVIDQLAGGAEAISVLRQATNGELVGMTAKDQIAAAIALADRSGFSPLGRSSRPSLAGGTKLPALADMTPEQALQEEKRLIEEAWGREG